MKPLSEKQVEALAARKRGCADACAAVVASDAPVDVKRVALDALVRYATPKGVMRIGDLCSKGVKTLHHGSVPRGDTIQHEHVVPVRVLVDRMLKGSSPSRVLKAAVVAHVLASEHRQIGPLVTNHARLYEQMKVVPLAELKALGRKRYRASGLALATVRAPAA